MKYLKNTFCFLIFIYLFFSSIIPVGCKPVSATDINANITISSKDSCESFIDDIATIFKIEWCKCGNADVKNLDALEDWLRDLSWFSSWEQVNLDIIIRRTPPSWWPNTKSCLESAALNWRHVGKRFVINYHFKK